MPEILTFITTLLDPPIEADSRNWMACYADEEPDKHGRMAVGYGATKQAAVEDLKQRFPRKD